MSEEKDKGKVGKINEFVKDATILFLTIFLFLIGGSFGYTFTKSDKTTVDKIEVKIEAKADKEDLEETKAKIETIRCENNDKIEKLASAQSEIKDQVKEVEINILKELRAMNK